jgi:hypothetical protein
MMHDFGRERNQKGLFYQKLSAVRALQRRLAQRYGKRKTAFDLAGGMRGVRKVNGMPA